MTRLADMTGMAFGRLTVVERADGRFAQAHWRCSCSCGRESVVAGNQLRSGKTQSCGCYMRDRTVETSRTHGMSASREYSIWREVLRRCEDPGRPAYPLYGGRGIRVCDRWHEFSAFLTDMGPIPSKRHSIDRIDSDGHYESGNCRWALAHVQTRNRRVSKLDAVSAVLLRQMWIRAPFDRRDALARAFGVCREHARNVGAGRGHASAVQEIELHALDVLAMECTDA